MCRIRDQPLKAQKLEENFVLELITLYKTIAPG